LGLNVFLFYLNLLRYIVLILTLKDIYVFKKKINFGYHLRINRNIKNKNVFNKKNRDMNIK